MVDVGLVDLSVITVCIVHILYVFAMTVTAFVVKLLQSLSVTTGAEPGSSMTLRLSAWLVQIDTVILVVVEWTEREKAMAGEAEAATVVVVATAVVVTPWSIVPLNSTESVLMTKILVHAEHAGLLPIVVPSRLLVRSILALATTVCRSGSAEP